MDKPWGEMQKGSESKQVFTWDRELKKVSTIGLCSLVVCFTLTITILTITHYYHSFTEEEEER